MIKIDIQELNVLAQEVYQAMAGLEIKSDNRSNQIKYYASIISSKKLSKAAEQWIVETVSYWLNDDEISQLERGSYNY